MTVSLLIICIVASIVAGIIVLIFKKKKTSSSSDKFNAHQSKLDNTNTNYQDVDAQNEVQYSIPTIKINTPSGPKPLNITKWYINEASVLADFKESSGVKFLQKELDEVMVLNSLTMNELRSAVYNNKEVYVKDAQQVFLCLFVTFGFYEQNWEVVNLTIDNPALKVLINRTKDDSKKRSIFIKCE